MRSFLVIAWLALGFAVAQAAEPLIPEPVNRVLSQVRPGMTKDRLALLFSVAYPKATAQMGPWSGQTGYIDVILDSRYRVSIAAKFDSKQEEVVDDDLLIYVFDHEKKHRVEIREFWWEADEKEG